MPQACVSDGCKYTSRVLCHCCNQNLCLEHLKQHNEANNAQLNPLADEINTLSADLISLNCDKLTQKSREKLDQWRENCFAKINEFYEKKCEELTRHCHKQIDVLQHDLEQIRSKICKSIDDQEITKEDLEILQINLADLKYKLFQFQQKPLQITTRHLILNEKLISFDEVKIYELNLTKLPDPYRTIPCTEQSWPAMATNDRFLLVDQYPNIILLNHDLKIIKQISWPHAFIRSICWSSTANKFVIINKEKEVFFLDENCLSIERIQTIEEQYWWSCVCSDTSLFLTNTTMGTSIYQFNLLSSCQLTQRWKPPYSCKQHEYIDDISYQNGTLALVIKVSSNNTVHLDLRSSQTLERLWSTQLNIKKSWFQQTIRCCSLKYGEWLVVEGNTSHLFHILKNGKMKITEEYKPSPMNALLFGSNIFIVRTKDNVIFHRL
ncbi:unnamed protein product [Adineta ricciae]|uniref:Uncharacterized protein n=1 Tax=Adineta ricciae TaxID=249248 RepID=A0A813ZVR2_ADIRI|nr:unnamed protein product [Adineta ricciae]CAF1286325.1 unnamed protein product [Adineta ricciae]